MFLLLTPLQPLPLRSVDVSIFALAGELHSHVDAVSIATLAPTHFDLLRKCIHHRVRVLVEKPITESLTEAEELDAPTRSYDRVFQVGFSERFSPTYQELKKNLGRFISTSSQPSQLEPVRR